MILGGSAKDLENCIYLVQLTLSWEDRHPQEQFGHNTPYSEYVASRIIVVGSESTFWRPVPSGRYVSSVGWLLIMGVPRCSEVNHLNLVGLSVNNKVLRFNISMQKSSVVHKVYCLENLFHDHSDLFLIEASTFFSGFFLHELSQIHIEVFKHYVQCPILMLHLFSLNYIWVL